MSACASSPSETRYGGFIAASMVSSSSQKGFSSKISVYSVTPMDHISSSGPRYLPEEEEALGALGQPHKTARTPHVIQEQPPARRTTLLNHVRPPPGTPASHWG